jgi:hypothetical protein
MRWFWLLVLLGAHGAASADTIYLCKAYSGGMFWSSKPCGQQQATVDRFVTVPSNMSWEDKVEMGKASVAQAQAVTAPTPPVYVQQGPNPQVARQQQCSGLRDEINNIDAQSRLPQSGQYQDWLKQRRQALSDQRFRMQC